MRRNFLRLAVVFAFGVPLLLVLRYLVALTSDNDSTSMAVVQ